MKGHGGYGVDATLAALATLTAAWPISTLLAEPTWLRGTILLIAVIASTGVGARSLTLRGWHVLMVQLVCFVLAASTIYGQGHLWHGLPTVKTLGSAGRLIGQALATMSAYAAPAPTTPGLTFVVSCALALVALAVDYLAVTRGSPSLAGLPLLTVFLASAANSGSSLPVNFFLAAAAMWLILVARQGSAMLRRWGTTVAAARTPLRGTLDPEGVYHHASIARTMGAVALVAAVTIPAVLPQLPPKFLHSALGPSPLAESNVSGGVGFSLSIYLEQDLNDRSTAPVLQFTTADPAPPPLRIAVGSLYWSARGVWLPFGRPVPALSTNPDVPKPTGLSAVVPRKSFAMTFSHNLLNEPNLAVPYPLISAQLYGIAWGADDQTQNVTVAQRPDSYTASFWRLEPTATLLQSTPSLNVRDRHLFDLDLKLDGPSAGPVTALSERLTTGKTSDYDKAMAIQQYLRATGGFTYSLNLAPPAKDQFGRDANFDPLTNFLVTKRGYCVQFATAMVMMSRAVGIPARMAIGFLPGTRANGVWTVTASDAHAWPELYLDGIGWTRFEPTPSRAAPPVYAIPATSPGTVVGGRPLHEATTPTPGHTAPKDLGTSSTNSGASPDVGLSLTSVLHWLTRGWGSVLLGSLVGLLGSLVVPTAARWRRRRILITARTAAQRVEVQWELLTSSLGDLGIAPAPARTPRQLRAYYDREAFLDGEASDALGRVVQTLERSRYALSPPAPSGLAADARQVFRAAAATRRGRDRLRATLWPSSGIAQLRSARADFAWRIQAPLRDVSDVVRQRFPRRRT
jgi:transglutaminase-like putative cysteine protease